MCGGRWRGGGTWHPRPTLSCILTDIIIVKLGTRFLLSCRCGSLKLHSVGLCHISSTNFPLAGFQKQPKKKQNRGLACMRSLLSPALPPPHRLAPKAFFPPLSLAPLPPDPLSVHSLSISSQCLWSPLSLSLSSSCVQPRPRSVRSAAALRFPVYLVQGPPNPPAEPTPVADRILLEYKGSDLRPRGAVGLATAADGQEREVVHHAVWISLSNSSAALAAQARAPELPPKVTGGKMSATNFCDRLPADKHFKCLPSRQPAHNA